MSDDFACQGPSAIATSRCSIRFCPFIRLFVSVFQFSRLERRHLADDAMELTSLDQKGDDSPSMPRNWDADTNGLTDTNGYCKSSCGLLRGSGALRTIPREPPLAGLAVTGP